MVDEIDEVNPDDLDEIDSLFFEHEESSTSRTAAAASRLVVLISPTPSSGKTSIAVMLAGYLTTRRRRVGLVDMDPQQGVDRWSSAGRGLPFAIFTFDPCRGAPAFRRLLREAVQDHDLLVVDTPSTMGPATRLALQVADVVLIPAGASTQDLEAARTALRSAEREHHGRDGDLPLIGIVPSRQDGRTRLAKDFAKRLGALATPITPAVGQRVEVAAAARAGRLVRPSTAAGKEFRRLSRHVLSLLRRIDNHAA
jgi:cellulose biosynthesis protein BcsQ